MHGLRLPESQIEKALKELAEHIADRKKFLMLAKNAWNQTHYDSVPKRGKRSVAEKCFLAIWDAYHELPGSNWPENYGDVYGEYTIWNYEQYPSGDW